MQEKKRSFLKLNRISIARLNGEEMSRMQGGMSKNGESCMAVDIGTCNSFKVCYSQQGENGASCVTSCAPTPEP